MKTILVTGASGFLGRHVVERLRQRGDNVVVLSRDGALKNQTSDTFRCIKGNLADGTGVGEIPWEAVDQVIHLAAAGVKASNRTWSDALGMNVVAHSGY